MSRVWTNELELTFLEYFQAEPILWNTNLKDYKNKLKNYDAWQRISALMEIPIDELKHKKNSLLASYRGYKNKVKKSENSGAGFDDVYQPIWFAYEYMDSFLGDTTKCKNTINTVTQSVNSEDRGEQLGEEYQAEQSPQVDETQTLNTKALPTIRRRKHPTELSEAGKVMKEALSTFKETVKRNESQLIIKEDDDCDLYAKLMAKKLRRLPEDKRLRLMHAIDGMFLSSEYTVHSESSSPIQTLSPQPQHAQFTQSRNLSYDLYDQRPGTSFSSHSEPIMRHSPTPSPQPQHANQFTRSLNLSCDQYPPRPRTSFSSHSEPIMYYSPASSPQSQPAKAIRLTPVNIHKNNAHNRSQGSNIIIQSNDVIYPPVIHIPEQNTNAEINTVNEDTAVVTNIIEEAFLSS